ncbi:MAG: esterase/lipase family protein [Thermoplasmatota archaeon]
MNTADDRTPSRRPTVVLVPGAFGQDFVYWNIVRRALDEQGIRSHTITFPRLTLSDLTTSARRLASRLDVIRAAEGDPEIVLVAHSLGGLISRYYLNFLRQDADVRLLMCLGVPHRGTVAAATGVLLKGARQALPGSPFLKRLNSVAHRGPPILNIYSSSDFVVFPQSSAKLEVPGVVNVDVPLVGHWGLLVSRRVQGWMTDLLTCSRDDVVMVLRRLEKETASERTPPQGAASA